MSFEPVYQNSYPYQVKGADELPLTKVIETVKANHDEVLSLSRQGKHLATSKSMGKSGQIVIEKKSYFCAGFMAFLRNIRRGKPDKKWSLITLLMVLLLSTPILTLLLKLPSGPGESWPHVVRYLLPGYLINTAKLVVLCTLFSLLLGVLPAWVVSQYHFPLRRLLEWALILPLAIPGYLIAYAYAGLFDHKGSFATFLAFLGSKSPQLHIMNITGLALVLSCALYPYIYLAARSFFMYASGSLVNAARSMGAGNFKTFYTIALPLARPAIAGGLLLVLMEVLSDYGAAHYYGVTTFTTAIFRAWFGMEEPQTAIYLSGILCLIILGLIILERRSRGKRKYQFSADLSQPPARKVLPKAARFVALICTAIPFLLGFLLPLIQMLRWAFQSIDRVALNGYGQIIGSSLALGLVAALISVMVAFLIIYSSEWSRSSQVRSLSKLSILGYAVPGAVIAVGVLLPTLAIDKFIASQVYETFGRHIGFIINGSLMGLLFAYTIRFMAVSYHPLEACFQKTGNRFEKAAQVLGISKWQRTTGVNLPLNQAGMVTAFALVFVDVMKELPLTLLLKPYNVMTLSVKAYEYASDERIAEASVPALMIVAVGLIPVIILNRLLKT